MGGRGGGESEGELSLWEQEVCLSLPFGYCHGSGYREGYFPILLGTKYLSRDGLEEVESGSVG